mmetsp:Transcript_14301/g.30325  ORF Transcript_14301/g.30325 Transcript_14301/m.30325 type:complete len:117 (-) Transcript_14301:81-431(-)
MRFVCKRCRRCLSSCRQRCFYVQAVSVQKRRTQKRTIEDHQHPSQALLDTRRGTTNYKFAMIDDDSFEAKVVPYFKTCLKSWSSSTILNSVTTNTPQLLWDPGTSPAGIRHRKHFR